MKKFIYYIPLFLFISCIEDDSVPLVNDNETILSKFLEDKTFLNNQVIACAASDSGTMDINNIYFYPEAGASDFRLYQSWADDEKDFSSYQFVPLNSEPVFQGALRVFKLRSDCKWTVVIYEKEDKTEISTPIRMKLSFQPTIWSTDLTVDQSSPLMPHFSWFTLSEENNAIFFQVLSTEDLALLSGTYTEDNHFQYYKLNNVVLNVTPGEPPGLISGETYIFTVMDVSIDNWVNHVIMSPFTAE
ncbi:hypothetical protein E1J38_005420 [Seonamhaeicola sediminis]|uniref:Uncharacterized protein n=1 Tax=Seonamhaeicola sediminis TaxID=2528206 RepID=A0A562YG07_9FLAO|nr:hypothetical protein [Seonamhaeicola sediminis]TWO33332.1 hypothetical protein E1J38_005420 [Seonamhaeicola sediminis]